MIRALVVEDSAVTREYVVHLIGEDPDLEVVGVARDGLEALEQVERLRPDVVLMDVHMPRLNGFEATRRIMEAWPTPIVMMSASFSRDEVAMSFEALRAGALVVVEKPVGPDHPDRAETVARLLQAAKLMAEVKVIRRWASRERPLPPPRLPVVAGRRVRLVAIGASTGGPAAVKEILAGLPGDLDAGILLVQHIAAGFSAGLVEWLAQGTRLGVRLAEPGQRVRPGTVCVAPQGFQLGITPAGAVSLAREPAENGFCPSASYLFRSVAETYGRSAMGVLLTGMGRDGAAGLRRLREAGGLTVAQSEESCVVFGMPEEAIRLGAAECVLPPEQIARLICSVVPAR